MPDATRTRTPEISLGNKTIGPAKFIMGGVATMSISLQSVTRVHIIDSNKLTDEALLATTDDSFTYPKYKNSGATTAYNLEYDPGANVQSFGVGFLAIIILLTILSAVVGTYAHFRVHEQFRAPGIQVLMSTFAAQAGLSDVGHCNLVVPGELSALNLVRSKDEHVSLQINDFPLTLGDLSHNEPVTSSTPRATQHCDRCAG